MQIKTKQSNSGRTGKLPYLVSGIAAIIIGLIGSSFGSAWSPQVYELLFEFKVIESIDSFMPYFPFVPFYPIFIIMLGAFLIDRSRN